MHANSVHLQKTPNFQSIPHNENIVEAMSLVRKICNGALSIRKKNNIKARIPLASITIAGNCEAIKNNTTLIETIKDEINVKNVIFLEDFSNFSVKKIVNLDASKIAKRLGKNFPAVLQMAKTGNYRQNGINIVINGHEIFADEHEIQLILQNNDTNYTSLDGKYLIILDTQITQTLQNEGIARDFVRSIQNTRKEMGLNITDQISIKIHTQNNEIKVAINENIEYIKEQVLAKNIDFSQENLENAINFGEDVNFVIKI